MATASLSDEALVAFFHAHPNLRDRVTSIVGAVENANGDLGGVQTGYVGNTLDRERR